MNLSDSNQFRDAALIGYSSINLRDLSGFDRKLHNVPSKYDDYARTFVAEKAKADIENQTEEMFQRLRKSFDLKRKEVNVLFPEPGWGTIETPFFSFCINVTPNKDDISLARIEKSLRQISSSDQILSEQFSLLFDFVFDRIEFTFEQTIDLERWIDAIEENGSDRHQLNYDSQATQCVLTLGGIVADIHVTPSKFAVVYPKPASTREIFSAFMEAQEAVASGMVETKA